MAAWDLALRGYSITVYEAEGFLGGQIETIPKYHMDGDELDIDLARFRNLDITFVGGKRAGVDFTPESLLQEGYLAVLVAIGASKPRMLGIPGEDLPGVYSALPFLLAVNKGPGGLFGRKGRRIVVVGGGDVALDGSPVGQAARRCRGGGAPLPPRSGERCRRERRNRHGGEVEGVRFLFQRAPVKVLGAGRVEGMVVERTELGPPDGRGRRPVSVVPNSEETIPCDTIILAVGETADVSGLPAELDFTFASMGWPVGKREDWMTDSRGGLRDRGSVGRPRDGSGREGRRCDRRVHCEEEGPSARAATRPLRRPRPSLSPGGVRRPHVASVNLRPTQRTISP